MRCRGFPWFYPRASNTLVLMRLRKAVVFLDATFNSKALVSRVQDTTVAAPAIANTEPEMVCANPEFMKLFTIAITARRMKS
jgi:hypothetical protein